jgi:hypothetical protein
VWAVGLATLYGSINSIVLGREEDAVSYEVVLGCVFAYLGFCLVYVFLAPSGTTQQQRALRRRHKKTKTPKPSKDWWFPISVPLYALASLIVLLAISRTTEPWVQGRILRLGLSLPSSVVTGHVSTLLSNAREKDVIIPPSLIRRNGLKFIRASENNYEAWSDAVAMLGYRSFLNDHLNMKPQEAGTPKTSPEVPYYMTALATRPNPDAIAGTYVVASVQYEGTEDPKDSARLESLSNPQPVGSGAKLIRVFGKTDSVVLDGEYLKHVILENANVIYDGGPVKLEDVYFVTCRFTVSPTPGGRAFAKEALKGGAVNFTYSGERSVAK